MSAADGLRLPGHRMCADGWDEDVTSLAVQPDASSSIQFGGKGGAQTQLVILCSGSPQIGCVTPQKAASSAGAIKSPHREKHAVWRRYSAELVSVWMRWIVFFFPPLHGDASVPLYVEASRVLSCAFVLHRLPRGPRGASHRAQHCVWSVCMCIKKI